MARYSETESPASETESPVPIRPNRKKMHSKKKSGEKKKKTTTSMTTSRHQWRSLPTSPSSSEAEAEEEEFSVDRVWKGRAFEASWSRRGGRPALEGYVEMPGDGAADQASDEGSVVSRTKSLTDDDLDELKGCLDLGFSFSYEDIPGLCGTLPALELCYSMSRSLESAPLANEVGPAEQPCATPPPPAAAAASPPIANWKIASPGDDPEEVKARLKYWAQAVAFTVRLCS